MPLTSRCTGVRANQSKLVSLLVESGILKVRQQVLLELLPLGVQGGDRSLVRLDVTGEESELFESLRHIELPFRLKLRLFEGSLSLELLLNGSLVLSGDIILTRGGNGEGRPLGLLLLGFLPLTETGFRSGTSMYRGIVGVFAD